MEYAPQSKFNVSDGWKNCFSVPAKHRRLIFCLLVFCFVYSVEVIADSPPDIRLEYLGDIITNGADEPSQENGTDFGALRVESETTTHIFRIHNVGSNALIVFNPSSSDVQFGINGMDSIISGGGFDDFEISFRPDVVGPSTAVISIPSNDEDEMPFTFRVAGEGLPGEPGIGDLVPIPTGIFSLGSPETETGRLGDELSRSVTVERYFEMSVTEVTNLEMVEILQWAIDQGHIVSPDPEVNYSGNLLVSLSSAFCKIAFADGVFSVAAGFENYPVVEVSWYGAVAYGHFRSLKEGKESCYDLSDWSCDFSKNGYRLPTEAEWEYACRAGTSTAFYTGDITQTGSTPLDPNLDAVGWYTGNSGGSLQPVAQKTANLWGLKDMHGNVWEWCWDWYGDYPTGSEIDPDGPEVGTQRVNRGGGYDADAWLCRAAVRGKGGLENPYRSLGFRIVKTTNPNPEAIVRSNSPVTDYDGDGFEVVTLDGRKSLGGAGAEIVSWTWSWEGPSSPENGEIIEIGFPLGITEVTLTVTDENGFSDSITIPVRVNQPPVAVNTSRAYIADPGKPHLFYLIDRSYDPDGKFVSYGWILVRKHLDGTIEISEVADDGGVSGPTTAVFFLGTTEVFLIVTDEDGATAFDYRTITIEPAAIPNAVFTWDTPIIDEDGDGYEWVVLDGSGSSPGVGDGDDLLIYDWYVDCDCLGYYDGHNPAYYHAELPVGTTEVTLVVRNRHKEDSVTVSVTVEPFSDDPSGFSTVPKGSFTMGTNDLGNGDESPSRGVTFDRPLWVKTHEITERDYFLVLQWAYDEGLISLLTSDSDPDVYEVVAANTVLMRIKDWAENEPYFRDGQFYGSYYHWAELPVTNVSWYGAVAYGHFRSLKEGKESCYDLSEWSCDFSKNGYRLPTEAEWEYAARGGLDGKSYPWGDGIDSTLANYDNPNGIRSVGTYAPNGYGLYDMAGNVWEWCWDLYGSYPSSNETDPLGPSGGEERVNRGGGWDSSALHSRVSQRGKGVPETTWQSLGFRVVIADDKPLPQYSVGFVLGDKGTRTGGGELVQQIEEGDAALAPLFSVQEGWKFTAWDLAFSKITNDLTVTALYSQVHSVRFNLGVNGSRSGGGELNQSVEHASSAIAPVVMADAGWIFRGWDTFFSIVTADLEVLALYEPAADHPPILSGSDFPPGGSVHLMMEFPAEGPDGVNGLGVSLHLPDGWSFVSDTASKALIRPQQGDEGTIEWAWLSAPDYPFSFSFIVAADSTGDNSVILSGSSLYTNLSNQQQERNLEEIVLFPVTRHSADSNGNWAIELAELLKVIGLYNTREGSIRTGSFHCDGQSEPGYSAGLGNQTCTIHSSDFSPMDWKINLPELLRLILLYNYREDATRTGQYHLDTDQIDGFAPGPESIPDVPSGFPGKLTNTPLKYAAEEGNELVVASDSTLFLEKGGQIILNIPVFYDEAIASLGLELDIPKGWNFESDNTVAVVKPQQGETTSTLGWAWVEGFPENGSTIQVVLGYPSGLDGDDVRVGGRLYVNTTSFSYSPLTLMEAYELSLVASPEDGGMVSGAGVFEAGSNVLISAVPQRGYRFAGWSGEGVAEPDQQETVVSLSKDLVVTAHFERQFSLTVNSPFGLVDIDPQGVIYPSGDTVVLTATPFDGLAFKLWTVDGKTQTTNPISVLMNQDRVVTAHYELNVSEEYLEFIGSGIEPLELVEPKGDIDFDGIPNFVEFVTGVDNGGKAPSKLGRPLEAKDGATDQIIHSFVFAADPNLKRGELTVCVSHDLVTWEEQSIISFESNHWSASNEPTFGIGPTTAEIDSGGAWKVEVLYTVDKSMSKDRTFFRLKAIKE